MQRYVMRRLLLFFPTLFLVTIVIFSLLRFIPGDIVSMMVDQYDYAEALDEMRARRGLNKPVHVQYLEWMGGILRGDLGSSLWRRRTILEELSWRFPVTLELALLSFIMHAFIAIPIGIFSAVRQDTLADYVLRSLAILGIAVPTF